MIESWRRLCAVLWLVGITCQISHGEDSEPTRWTGTGDMNDARVCFAAAVLPDGKVMVTGGYSGSSELDSTELYDPALGTFQAGPPLAQSRSNHTATTLTNGQVLVVGGQAGGNTLASAELYNPATGSWTETGRLHIARSYHTATLLSDGKVLVTGGIRAASPPVFAQAAPEGSALDTAELYDPGTGKWTVTDNMHTARYVHTATTLANGDVLVCGGMGSSKWANTRRDDEEDRFDRQSFGYGRPPAFVDALSSAEIYSHRTGTWTAVASMNIPRFDHTATLLPNGTVLVVTGQSNGKVYASAETYDVSSGSWTATGNLHKATNGHTATLLKDGRILLAGGCDNAGPIKETEFYDPSTRAWSFGPPLNNSHALQIAALLADGKVLVAGGCAALGLPIAAETSAEIFDPNAKAEPPSPIIAPAPTPIPNPTPVANLPPNAGPTLAFLPPPPSNLVTLAGSLMVVTFCVVIITACVVVLLAVWVAFVFVERWRK